MPFYYWALSSFKLDQCFIFCKLSYSNRASMFRCKQALWLHRRFLSLFWIKHFLTGHTGLPGHWKHKTSMNNDFGIFVDHELHLLQSCSIIPDNNFDDYQAQATYSATYMLWLVKVLVNVFHLQYIITLNLFSLIKLSGCLCYSYCIISKSLILVGLNFGKS